MYSLTIPRIAVPADGHRDLVRQMKTVRRPPICPNGAQAISPAAPSPPFRCPHALLRWIRVKAPLDSALDTPEYFTPESLAEGSGVAPPDVALLMGELFPDAWLEPDGYLAADVFETLDDLTPNAG